MDQAMMVTLILVGLITFLAVLYILVKSRAKHIRIYKQKGQFLLSPGERKLFEALVNVVDPTLYICPKVRIADIIEVAIPQSDNKFWSRFNRISQKHVDFLICDRNDFSPRVVIELDGGSHNDPSKSQRDEFVDSVFKDAEIPIVHIKAASFYEYKELREVLGENIKTRS